MKTQCLSVLVASFLFAACGKEAGHTDDHAAGGHGAMASLGSIQLGSVAVEV